MKAWYEYTVGELLPHAGSMMLLERVLEFDSETMVTEVIAGKVGPFGDGLNVPAWVGIEYMAQSVAALGGMRHKLAGKQVNVGFLLGTRRYDCNVDAFAVGTVLTVRVMRLIQDQGIGVYECSITGDGISASAKLNVYQPVSSVNRVLTD